MYFLGHAHLIRTEDLRSERLTWNIGKRGNPCPEYSKNFNLVSGMMRETSLFLYLPLFVFNPLVLLQR
jgi:hypothetical protein